MKKGNKLYDTFNKYLSKIGLSPISFIAFVIIALFPVMCHNEYYIKLALTSLMWGTLAMGFDFSVGYINVSNWGYAGLMGTGAYISALANQYFNVSPWLGMLIGGVIAALLGLLIALLTMKMDAMFAALLAWFVGIVLQNIVSATPDITRGAMGLNVKPLFKTPWSKPYFYVMLVMCLIIYCVLRKIVNSNLGLSFRALGQDLEAAKAIGISPLKFRTINFVISCFIAGLVGGFYAHYIGVLSPNVLGTKNVVQILVLAYLGGRGSIWGPLFGSFIIMPLFESMNSLVELKYIIYGLVLIVAMIFFPGGFSSLPGKVKNLIDSKKEAKK